MFWAFGDASKMINQTSPALFFTISLFCQIRGLRRLYRQTQAAA